MVFLIEIGLISILALILTAILSIISLYFRSKYKFFKDITQEFVNVVSSLLEMIEDDKITEDEIKEFMTSIKYLIIRSQKLIGSLK